MHHIQCNVCIVIYATNNNTMMHLYSITYICTHKQAKNRMSLVATTGGGYTDTI